MSGTFPKAWFPERTSGAQPWRREQKSLESGQTSMNGGSHVLQTSESERGRQAEVEGTGATMQGAMHVPGLDTLTIAEFACGGEAAL